MPETYYLDTVVESWRSEAKRLEATLADVRRRLQFAEGRLRTELEVNASLREKLADANIRLARIRAGGKA